jgi:hypothetical protein
MFVEEIRDLYSLTKMGAPFKMKLRSSEECRIMNLVYDGLKELSIDQLEKTKSILYYRVPWFMDNPKLGLDAWSLAIHQIEETIRRKTRGAEMPCSVWEL